MTAIEPSSHAARLHVIQADTRPFTVHGHSRSLIYEPDCDSEEQMREMNGGTLSQDWHHWSLSVIINRLKCEAIGCQHHVLPIRAEDHPNRHVTWGKISVLQSFLRAHPEAETVVFLDADAFIRDEVAFLALVEALQAAPDKHVALSRDPLVPRNSYINTGCVILKNSDFTRKFLDTVWNAVEARPQYRFEWPCEQAAASDFVRQNREYFLVCKITALNTPCGDIVRHVWWKNQFNELAEEELKVTVAKRVCADLVQTLKAHVFDLAELLDGEHHGAEYLGKRGSAGGMLRSLFTRIASTLTGARAR